MADEQRYAPTFAQRFTDAVWAASDGDLTATEAFTLLAYVRHVRRGDDTAWLTQRRLMALCKFVSMGTPVAARRSLVGKGWLVPVGSVSVRGGKAVRYRLVIPPSDTPGVSLDGSDTTRVSLDQSSDTTRVSLRDPKRYAVHSEAIRQTPESDTAAVSGVFDSAPPIGGGHAGVRAGAHAYAREDAARGASSRKIDDSLSTNGKTTWTREAAIAHIRETLADRKRP